MTRQRDFASLMWAVGAVAGAALVVVAWLRPHVVPHEKTLALAVLALAVARLALWKRPLAPAHQTVVLLSCVAVLAVLAAPTIATPQAQKLFGAGVALFLGVFFRRRPEVAVIGLFFLASTYTSFQAFLHTSPYPLHDGLLAGLMIAVLLSYVTPSRNRRAVPIGGAVVFGVFIAIAFVYSQVGSVPLISQRAFHELGWYMLVGLAVAYGPWGPEVHERIIKGMLVVIALVSAYAVMRWIVGPSGPEKSLVLSDPQAKYNYSDGKLNVFGSFPNTRSLGVWTASVLPACVALVIGFRGRWRLLALFAAAATFAALIGSDLRTGILASAVGCVVVLALLAATRAGRAVRLQILVVAMAALVITAGVLVAVAPSTTTSTHSYSAILHPGSDPSYQARIYKWSEAWRDADRHPFGQGLGTAGQASRYQRFLTIAHFDVDNSYLTIALDMGIFGLIMFGAALFTLLTGLGRRTLATADPQKAVLGAAGAGALAAFIVTMWTGNYIEGLPAFTAWLFVGLGLAQFATVPATEPVESRLALPRTRRRRRSRRLAHV